MRRHVPGLILLLAIVCTLVGMLLMFLASADQSRLNRLAIHLQTLQQHFSAPSSSSQTRRGSSHPELESGQIRRAGLMAEKVRSLDSRQFRRGLESVAAGVWRPASAPHSGEGAIPRIRAAGNAADTWVALHATIEELSLRYGALSALLVERTSSATVIASLIELGVLTDRARWLQSLADGVEFTEAPWLLNEVVGKLRASVGALRSNAEANGILKSVSVESQFAQVLQSLGDLEYMLTQTEAGSESARMSFAGVLQGLPVSVEVGISRLTLLLLGAGRSVSQQMMFGFTLVLAGACLSMVCAWRQIARRREELAATQIDLGIERERNAEQAQRWSRELATLAAGEFDHRWQSSSKAERNFANTLNRVSELGAVLDRQVDEASYQIHHAASVTKVTINEMRNLRGSRTGLLQQWQHRLDAEAELLQSQMATTDKLRYLINGVYEKAERLQHRSVSDDAQTLEHSIARIGKTQHLVHDALDRVVGIRTAVEQSKLSALNSSLKMATESVGNGDIAEDHSQTVDYSEGLSHDITNLERVLCRSREELHQSQQQLQQLATATPTAGAKVGAVGSPAELAQTRDCLKKIEIFIDQCAQVNGDSAGLLAELQSSEDNAGGKLSEVAAAIDNLAAESDLRSAEKNSLQASHELAG